ncbi:helix-turn-helix transcriptional regulator [uncultured Tenacibaculum sp.]|uniref:ArsR/SmtB family transcription factor n=1 Tax=uncultured Tenacibaculum sp. TaxID=174713 RepID=UPI00260DC8FE|nr:helix-turn-helix transcriptional regulator [uncultured Tenacibaculum sp.]
MESLENDFSEIASLLGDKSRAIMLWNLLDGRAYTATELANCSGISLQSASNHLAKLLQKNILSVEKQGRHRYYKFSSPDVAQVIESMASLLSLQQDYKKVKKPKASAFTYARTCYNHLAGEVGVIITEALISHNIISPLNKEYIVTATGKQWFLKLDINIDETQNLKRSFAHQCLDWSERKHHLAGALGDVFLETLLKEDWFRKHKNTRELIITAKGKQHLKQLLNIDL